LRRAYPDIPPLDECDEAKVEAALAQAFQSVAGADAYPGDPAKLAAFMYFVGKSHMCWTGAKRITAALTLAMLARGDCWLTASSDELFDAISRIASSDAHEMYSTLEWLGEWSADHLTCAGSAEP